MSSAREIILAAIGGEDATGIHQAQVTNILRALDAAGYAVVPKEPTEAMIDAWEMACPSEDETAAEADWRAMVAAEGSGE